MEHQENKPNYLWTCPECDVEQSIGEAYLVLFTKQPWFNYTQMNCNYTDCGAVHNMFVGHVGMEDLDDVPFTGRYEFDFAPDNIVEGYKQVHDITDLESKEIDFGKEKMIERWAKALEGVEPFDISHEK